LKHLKQILCVLAAVCILSVGIVIPSSAASKSNEETVFTYLTETMGLTNAAACGVMANIKAESEFIADIGSSSSGYGICQWTGPRYNTLVSYCNNNGFAYNSLNGQLHYLQYELEKTYTSTLSMLKSTGNSSDEAYNAAYSFCAKFEAPAGGSSTAAYRGNIAVNTFWPSYGNRETSASTELKEEEKTDENGKTQKTGKWYLYDKTSGQIKTDVTGFVQNKYGWWRVENGQVNFTCTDVLKGTVNGVDGWYYVENGKVRQDDDSIRQNVNGWWKTNHGKVDFTYTGVAQNEHGWWRVENGKVNFNFTGLAQNQYGWWYLKDGKVDFTHSGIVENQYGSWYVKNGRVQFGYSGRVLYNGSTYVVYYGRVTG